MNKEKQLLDFLEWLNSRGIILGIYLEGRKNPIELKDQNKKLVKHYFKEVKK